MINFVVVFLAIREAIEDSRAWFMFWKFFVTPRYDTWIEDSFIYYLVKSKEYDHIYYGVNYIFTYFLKICQTHISKVWAYKASLTSPQFTEVPLPNQESEQLSFSYFRGYQFGLFLWFRYLILELFWQFGISRFQFCY